MTNLRRRVQKLERTEILTRHLPLLEQLQRALNDAALRLTGKDFSFVEADESAMVMNEVWDSFLEKLNDADLASLISELEPIAFGDDTAALEAAKLEAVRAADEEFGCCVLGPAMINPERRIKTLETSLIDASGLMPHSQRWLADWDQQIFHYMMDPDGKPPEVLFIIEASGEVMKFTGDPASLVGSIPAVDE